MGEGRWKSSYQWPPTGFQDTKYFFGPQNKLLKDHPAEDSGSDPYQVDFSTSTGVTSRWVSLVNITGKKIGYSNRQESDNKLIFYQTQPLMQAVEVTGHPIISLFVQSSDPDPLFFVYLEDVFPNGDVRYVTEGQIRGMQRKISTDRLSYTMPVPMHTYRREDALPLVPGVVAGIHFDLQPVSYQFAKEHAIRVALAGADKDNFEIIPDKPPRWEILRTPEHPSSIQLPIKVI